MNSLFRKIFGTLGEEVDDVKKSEVRSPYTPDISLPIEEQFTLHFKKNGGKFIYCENLDEISENFENILAENEINMSKIQSMPVLGKRNEYNFYVDVEWTDTKKYEETIRKILKYTINFSIMGEYVKNDGV